MQHVNCETLDINDRWSDVGPGGNEAEAGRICKFDLTNHQQPWILSENFTCGTSNTRVVMCRKGLDLIQMV